MKSFKEKIKLKEIIVDAEKGNAESQAYLACSYFEGKFGKKTTEKHVIGHSFIIKVIAFVFNMMTISTIFLENLNLRENI